MEPKNARAVGRLLSADIMNYAAVQQTLHEASPYFMSRHIKNTIRMPFFILNPQLHIEWINES